MLEPYRLTMAEAQEIIDKHQQAVEAQIVKEQEEFLRTGEMPEHKQVKPPDNYDEACARLYGPLRT